MKVTECDGQIEQGSAHDLTPLVPAGGVGRGAREEWSVAREQRSVNATRWNWR